MYNITAGRTILVKWNTGGVNTGNVELRLLPAELSDDITNWNNNTLCKSFLTNSQLPYIGANYGAQQIQLVFGTKLRPGPYTMQWRWVNVNPNRYSCADMYVINPLFSGATNLSMVSVVVFLTISFLFFLF